MDKLFDINEIKDRINLNLIKLRDNPYYQIEQVFSPSDYDWYGDKEGRALLSFVSHYKISGVEIPCMHEMMKLMPQKTNGQLFFGPFAGEVIHEQQLSGHSWLLRGLCEYYEQFNDAFALEMINSICKNLYLPTKGRYHTYPIERNPNAEGAVSGSIMERLKYWALSSDVGCAFMSIDGLSHAYKVLKDDEIKTLVDEMIDVYLAIDKVKLMVQTHCTLTAARGMMRMYDITGESKYLDGAISIWVLYTEHGGMTYTYQNANWWGRNDTWTEPCAIVDSLMLSCQLYLATGNEKYRKTAARIYHNGLATAQRDSGGAGTDTVVTRDAGGTDTLYMLMIEAFFCCSMRLTEGLWYVNEHQDLLYAEVTGKVEKQENGVYMDGDIIYAEMENADKYLNGTPVVVDGHTLYPLLKYYNIPRADADLIKQKVIFD